MRNPLSPCSTLHSQHTSKREPSPTSCPTAWPPPASTPSTAKLQQRTNNHNQKLLGSTPPLPPTAAAWRCSTPPTPPTPPPAESWTTAGELLQRQQPTAVDSGGRWPCSEQLASVQCTGWLRAPCPATNDGLPTTAVPWPAADATAVLHNRQ